MKRKALKKEIDDLLKSIADYAKKTDKTHEEEDIHKLRTTYKKLRALLRMSQGKLQKIDLPKPFRNLYRTAGAIRDLQLHHKTVSGYFMQYDTMPENYLQHINEEIKKAVAEFNKAYRQFSASRTRKLLTKDLPDKISDKKITQWRERHFSNVNKFRNNDLDDDSIHVIRKLLKDLDYTGKYLPGGNDFKDATDSLGAYIDKFVLLELLYKYGPGNADEQKMLEFAGHRWRMEKQVLKEELTAMISELKY